MRDTDYDDGDWELDPEVSASEDDGRDSSPVVGDSDAPENMAREDPLRRDQHRADEALRDLDGSGGSVVELTEKDDDPEW